jgi:TraG P-loop domain
MSVTNAERHARRADKRRARRERARARRAVGGRARLPQAGELLAVEAIDRTGLVVTSEGAFVRVFRVVPPNPLLMSDQERAQTAATFERLIGQLPAEETLQIYIQARPVNQAELLEDCRTQVQASAGPPPTRDRPGRDALARSQWRLYAALEESMLLHADEQGAVHVCAHVVVPWTPRQSTTAAALAWARQARPGARGLRSAALERPLAAHRRAVREHLAHVDSLRAELEAEGMSTELLAGEQVFRLLQARFNPTQADLGRTPAPTGEVLGELDPPAERATARTVALKLREQIARSALDFSADHHHVVVDRDVEQTLFVQTTVGRTQMGWLHRAMLTRQPFTLSVFVQAQERRRERQKLKLRYRRMHTINRGAEQRGRVPDFDRALQEHELGELLAEMASGQQTNVFRVSIYQTLRARGPRPNLAALSEAVDWCAEAIESAGDCRVNRGEFHQQALWESSLPLGRDVFAHRHKYPTDNTADMLALVGTTCGSPTGVPFAFTDPGRTVELLNPYDEEHFNHTMLISGRSGSGKTMTANVLLSRCLALGARAFVLDRAGHYETLTRLVDGAQQIEIGADDSPYALNPWDVPDPAKVSRKKLAFLLDLHQLVMGGLGPREVGLLGAAIRAVYAKAAALGEQPRESMLRDELKAQAKESQDAGAVDVAATLRNLADRLAEYCGEGTYAYLLDRDTTLPTDARLVVFDTRRCPDSELRLVMFAVMEYVTNSVERHWAEHRGQAAQPGAALFVGRSIMLIDEAWHLISRAETGEFANDLARRARHLGLTLIVMSQQLSDFDTEHGVALLKNSSQRLLLAQEPHEIPFIQDALELSEREAKELFRLRTVKGRHAQLLWLNGTRGHGKVALRIGPKEYWAFTSHPVEVAAREAEIHAHDGNVWAAIDALAKRNTRTHNADPTPPPSTRERKAGQRGQGEAHNPPSAP